MVDPSKPPGIIAAFAIGRLHPNEKPRRGSATGLFVSTFQRAQASSPHAASARTHAASARMVDPSKPPGIIAAFAIGRLRPNEKTRRGSATGLFVSTFQRAQASSP
jgi:hypothetical protein